MKNVWQVLSTQKCICQISEWNIKRKTISILPTSQDSYKAGEEMTLKLCIQKYKGIDIFIIFNVM